VKRRVGCALIIALCVVALPPMPLGASSAGTLGDVLRAHGLTASPQVLGNLDKPITSYSIFDNGREFLIAYYLDDGTGLLTEPLFVHRYDAVAHEWKGIEITDRAAQTSDVRCLGSAVSIRVSAHAIYIGTHLNPSAGCTIVLSRGLAVQAVLPGWVLALFADETIVYERSQVHFAPTHYAELFLHDEPHHHDRQLYPMKPYQRIRIDHMHKVRRIYSNKEWCRDHNHHCDPERFDNFIVGDVAVNDTTGALAFQVWFDNTVYWSDLERWRLDSFRGLRASLPDPGFGHALTDDLFMRLYEDLQRAKRLSRSAHMLHTLEADRELFDLVAEAAARERRPGQNWRAFFDALDPRWERPELWARLARIISVPPEFTDVVYVYRNITNGLPIEYREMLLSDLGTRFGRRPLQRYLEPDMLRRIFGG
jgi:hypothetical protein